MVVHLHGVVAVPVERLHGQVLDPEHQHGVDQALKRRHGDRRVHEPQHGQLLAVVHPPGEVVKMEGELLQGGRIRHEHPVLDHGMIQPKLQPLECGMHLRLGYNR